MDLKCRFGRKHSILKFNNLKMAVWAEAQHIEIEWTKIALWTETQYVEI